MASSISIWFLYVFLTLVIYSEHFCHCVVQSSFQNEVRMIEKNPRKANDSSSLDDVEFPEGRKQNADETAGRVDSVIADGVQKLTEIYQDCNRKIDKRVETLLNWRLTNAKNVKDLLELKEYVLLLYRCLKVQSFRYFDTMIGEDVIPISEQVELVRDPKAARIFNAENLTNGRISSDYVAEIVGNDWNTLLLDRLSKLLGSHAMKFHLEPNGLQAGRGRRREYKMFAMMVMGFMIMATILIPMGFQFLTVLGGKSLLMAKMALIMSAINGLKKIATSPVGYGFYHSAPEAHHNHHAHHEFHDKLLRVGLKADNDNFI